MSQFVVIFVLLTIVFVGVGGLLLKLAKKPRVIASDKVCLETLGRFSIGLGVIALLAAVAIATGLWPVV